MTVHIPAPHALLVFLAAEIAPLIAFAASLLMIAAGRMHRAHAAWRLAIPCGALAGWGWRLAGHAGFAPWWHAVAAPRSTAAHLLLIAVIAILVAGSDAVPLGRLRGRWLAIAAAIVAGWWIARSPASGAQFWRAWLAASLLAALLGTIRGAGRLAAAPLAFAAALAVMHAPAPWPGMAFVLAAASIPILAVAEVSALPLALLVSGTVVAAVLGAGRMAHREFGPVDLAALLAVAAPWTVAPLTSRLGRAARAAPVVAAAIAGLLAYFGQLAHLYR